MSDKMRWRYGDTNPVVAAVDAATVIEIGDLVYLDTDDAKPASDYPGQGSENATQAALADVFLGVAMQRSPAGSTDSIRVATTGVFEYDCSSSTFELGAMVGADENAAAGVLMNQQVDAVANSSQAIGRVARWAPTPTTRVLVDIRSTVMTGGVEGSMISGI